MKILFIGDIMGKMGRKAVAKILPKLKKEQKIDLVIANIENSAHGAGATETTVKDLMEAGVDWFTNGDHAFDRIKQAGIYDKYPILRPANWSQNAPGNGFSLIQSGEHTILLINLIGRVFMKMDYECPFYKADEILANFANQNLSGIIIDIHAEATSEKAAIKHYLDGRVSAVLGTHTHIMTADEAISKQGTAFITDVGMVGACNECIGTEKEGIIKMFLSQIKYPHVMPEVGQAVFNSVLLNINPKNKKAKSIKPITKYLDIKR